MGRKRNDDLEPFAADLISALHALDGQVAREMQRSPAELERHGVQKWEPYAKRVEKTAAVVLDSIGEERCKLDSVLIMAQAMTKGLSLLIEELGVENLGELRSSYCRAAMIAIERDARNALALLRNDAAETMM